MQTSANTLTKTDAGIREMIERSLRLPAVQRRALILIDGKRCAAEVTILLGTEDVEGVFNPLLQAGLIRSSKAPTAVAPQAPPPSDS